MKPNRSLRTHPSASEPLPFPPGHQPSVLLGAGAAATTTATENLCKDSDISICAKKSKR